MGRMMGRIKAPMAEKVSAKLSKQAGMHAVGGVPGLYLLVSGTGGASWIFRYSFSGRRRDLGLGSYIDLPLSDARKKAMEQRRLILDGIDPVESRKAARSALASTRASALTFEQCALAYIASQEPGWKNAKHGDQWRNTLSTYAYPVVGGLLVRDVEQAHVLQILEPLWTTKTETASRLRGRIESVIDYATARGYRTGDNPARWRGHLDKLMPAPSKVAKVEHHAAMSYNELPGFILALHQQAGMGARALEFAILTAARSGEVRGATWGEIDSAAAVWTIPAGRMKAEKEHRIPLSAHALEMLRALPRVAGSDLIYPSTKGTPLSDMTLTAVLRRMDRGEVTAHGFRSTFRDWAGESTSYPREVIEHALAHQLKDKAEAAYARGTLFDKRRRLMDDWAKYCHTPQATAASVTPINSMAGA